MKRLYKTSEAFIHLYEQLKKADSAEKIIILCQNFNKPNRDIKCYITSYSINQEKITGRNFKDIYDEVYSYFNIYFEYQKYLEIEKNINNYRKRINNSLKIVNDFINSPLKRKDYCKEYNVNDLSRHVNIIKNDYPELHGQYIDKVKKERYTLSNDSFILSLELLSYLKNSNDNTNFDIIDYYLYINCDFQSISRATNELYINNKITKNDMKLIHDFLYSIGYRRNLVCFDANSPFDELGLDTIISERNVFMINNKQRIITEEEKLNIYNFLKDNQIPFNNKTYRTCILRLINEKDNYNKQKSHTK